MAFFTPLHLSTQKSTSPISQEELDALLKPRNTGHKAEDPSKHIYQEKVRTNISTPVITIKGGVQVPKCMHTTSTKRIAVVISVED